MLYKNYIIPHEWWIDWIFCAKKYICNSSYIIQVNKIFILTVGFSLFFVLQRYGKYMEIITAKIELRYRKKQKEMHMKHSRFCMHWMRLSFIPTSFIYNTRRTRFTKRLNNLILIHFAHYHRRCDIALPPLSGA